jgi:membrane fusion protein, multidrug efflux system
MDLLHMARRPLFFLLAASISVAGVAAWYVTREPATAALRPARGAAGVPVTAGVVQSQDFAMYLSGIGTAQAFNTVTVKPRVDGQLIKVAFTEGQEVKAGDVLAQIDPRPFEAQLAQAKAQKARDEAQLANAKRDLERFSNLAAREFASRQSVDAQRTQVEALTAAIQGDQAAIDNAQVQLGYTTITSPINGRTGIRLVDMGNIVHASDANGLVVITQVKPIAVIFTLPQDSLDQVTKAQAAQGTLKVQAFKRDDVTELAEGTLALVDNQIDPSTGTIRLKAIFANDDNALWPGLFVNVRLALGVLPNAVSVPAQVVQRGPNGTYAYVISNDQTVAMRPVKVGPMRDGVILIESGLAPGDHVVIDGQYKLHPGSRVETKSTEAARPAAGG